MRKSFLAPACVSVVLALTIGLPCQLQAQPKSQFFPVNSLPPQNSTYISPAQWHALYAQGIIISNVTHRGFTESTPPPPQGTSSTHTFNSELDFDLSLNNGGSFSRVTAPAQVTVNVQAISGGPTGPQTYNTRMLQLNVAGGTLPAGLQLRASTSLSSTGQTVIAPVSGGYMISSFFDIFTELSLDGGQSWTGNTNAGHMDMRRDPTLVPPVPEPTELVPPPSDLFISPPLSQTIYPGGVVITDVHSDLFVSNNLNLLTIPVGTLVSTDQFNATLAFQLSLNGGGTFTRVTAPAIILVTVQPKNPGPPNLYDLEMLQLDVSGTLPTGLKLRKSLNTGTPSYGELSASQASDGSYRLSSFFDIFTELSLDNGQTWQATSNGPTHVELQKPARLNKIPTAFMPASGNQYSFPGLTRYPVGAAGIMLSNVSVHNMSPSNALPPAGQFLVQTFTSIVDVAVSLDGGQSFANATAPAVGAVTVSNTSPVGTTGNAQYYSTELLQLSISGGTLPQGLMIRESPSKASLGRMSSALDPASGQYRIDSFFDVFTELSMDSGHTWNASTTDPSVVYFVPVTPPYAPYVISCPPDITVYATTPSGAIVNYSFPPITIFPDCPFCCFSAIGSPPSGSLFPIGTTTVTGTGSDGCGEHPTCSFKVTVLQPLIYAGMVDQVIGRALLSSSLVSTDQYIVVSNLFTDASDGFHLNLGAADSVFLNFTPFPSTVNCPTDYFASATAPYGQDPNHVMGTGAYFGGSNPTIQADFSSLGASQVILEVHDPEDNHLVYSNEFVNNAAIPVSSFFPPPCTNYNKTSYTYTQTPDHICYRFCIFGCNCQGTNCYIERVACIRPDIASLPVNVHLSGLDFRAAAASPPGSFQIQTQELGLFGTRHIALGGATFDSRAGVLMLNNVSSGGTDGVAIDLGSAGQYDMTLAPVMLRNTGTCIDLLANGTVNGMENSPIGSAIFSQLGSGAGVLVYADWTPIGSTNTTCYFYDANGNLISTLTHSSGVLGKFTSQGNLVGCGLRLKPTPGFDLRFDSPFSFIPQGGSTPYQGSEIQILATSPAGRLRSFSEFSLTGCSVNELAILGENAQPVLTGALKRTDGRFEVDGQGMAGAIYQLLSSTRVGNPTSQWTTVNSAIAGPDGTFQLFDSPTASQSQNFYQVKASASH